MLSQCHIRSGETAIETVRKHRRRAGQGFFGRLADCDDGSSPLVSTTRKQFDRAEQSGHVRVMATGVHAIFFARTSKTQTGSLTNRKRVQFRAEEHDRPRAVAQYADDAMAAHARRDRQARSGKPGSYHTGSTDLFTCNLGVCMQIAVALEHPVQKVRGGWGTHSTPLPGSSDGNTLTPCEKVRRAVRGNATSGPTSFLLTCVQHRKGSQIYVDSPSQGGVSGLWSSRQLIPAAHPFRAATPNAGRR